MIVRALDKDELKTTLAKWERLAGVEIAILFNTNGYRFVILNLYHATIQDAISGDLEKSISLLKKLARQQRLCGEGVDEKELIPAAARQLTQYAEEFGKRIPKPMLSENQAEVFCRNWLARVKLTRVKPGTSVVFAVFARAGGCCEFKGCAQPLYEKDGVAGNIGYLAHIVGAQINGPRGEDPLLAAEVNREDNLLLLCDAHHRHIDRIVPDEYPVSTLKAMQKQSQIDRDNYQHFRRFRSADVLTILTDILGVTTEIDRHQVFAALTERTLRQNSSAFDSVMRDAAGGRDANSPVYWGNFIETYKVDILGLIAAARNHGPVGPKGNTLALFALGNMPALILAGRLIGEARPFQLFHFFRNRNSWAWPAFSDAPNRSTVSYSQGDDRTSQAEVAVVLEVTAKLAEDSIPSAVRALPRITITVERLDQDPFSTPDELDALREEIHKALKLAQDELRARVLHVFTMAPADCVLAFGMKLQARNHSAIHVYQMPRGQPYFCALTLNSTLITAPQSGQTLYLV